MRFEACGLQIFSGFCWALGAAIAPQSLPTLTQGKPKIIESSPCSYSRKTIHLTDAQGLASPTIGPWYGGVQNVWGEENVPENALSRKLLDPSKRPSDALAWIFVQEKQSTDAWGGWKTYRTRGARKPLLGGVSFVRFSTPLLFPPPHGVLWNKEGSCFDVSFPERRKTIDREGRALQLSGGGGAPKGSWGGRLSGMPVRVFFSNRAILSL